MQYHLSSGTKKCDFKENTFTSIMLQYAVAPFPNIQDD